VRVLQVINTLAPGGAETLVAELVPRLGRKGVESEVYVFRRTGSFLERKLVQAGVRIYCPSGLSLYDPRQVFNLAAHLREHAYHVVHTHLFLAQLWTAKAVLLCHRCVPLVTTEHSTRNRRRQFVFRWLDRWMFGSYARVACVSRAVEAALLNWLPYLAKRTVVVENGIPLERIRAAAPVERREVAGTAEPVPLIISVGRLEAPKDHKTLLRALALLDGVHLALVGDGHLRTELESLARMLGIGRRVHFLGWREDVPHLLKAADVYVQPSRFEGFSLAVVEAMAAGLPVVASDVPGMAEAVGDAGLLFSPGDAGDLAQKLRMVLDDRALRERLAKMACQRVAAFDIQKTVQGYLELYREVTGRR